MLCGPGMYVNRALAAGLDAELTDAEWAHFEARSDAVGVQPTFEVSPMTASGSRRQLAARGYRSSDATSACWRHLADVAQPDATDRQWIIESVTAETRELWQELSAQGWGHTHAAARRASDAFTAAAFVVDGPNMVIARDRDTGAPVGVASMTVRGTIATLGGMSTVPTQRRRGVQTSLVRHRLRLARAQGCTMASSTAEPNSTSEQNLLRAGFERAFLIHDYERSEPAPTD